VGVRPEREEGQLLGLLGGRLRELGAAVAHLDDEQPGETVEIPLAMDVVDVGALALYDHRHFRVVMGAVPGEMHPQVVLCGFENVRARHRNLPSGDRCSAQSACRLRSLPSDYVVAVSKKFGIRDMAMRGQRNP
jgi:hypothetical protein